MQKQYSILYRIPTLHKWTSLMPPNGPHFLSLIKNKWYHCIVLCLRDCGTHFAVTEDPITLIFSIEGFQVKVDGRRERFFSSQQLRPNLLYVIHHWVSYTVDAGSCFIRPRVTEEWNWPLSPCPAKVNMWAIQLLALWRPSQTFTQFHGHRNHSHYWLQRSGRITNTRYTKTFNWKAIGVPKQIYWTLFFVHHHSPRYRFESEASTYLNSTK